MRSSPNKPKRRAVSRTSRAVGASPTEVMPAAPALPQFKTLSVTLHRDPGDAMRAGSVRAGSVTVPLTAAMLDALTADEREMFTALESRVDADGALVVRFDKLWKLPPSGVLPFSGDEVTADAVVGAIRAAIAREVARREELAREIRWNFKQFIDLGDGRIVHSGSSYPALLAARPGPRHPALGELDAFSQTEMRRIRNEARAAEAAAEAAAEQKLLDARKAYLALTDEELVRYDASANPPGWTPVLPSWEDPGDDDEAVSIVMSRAKRLALAANQRDIVARALPPSAEAAPA